MHRPDSVRRSTRGFVAPSNADENYTNRFVTLRSRGSHRPRSGSFFRMNRASPASPVVSLEFSRRPNGSSESERSSRTRSSSKHVGVVSRRSKSLRSSNNLRRTEKGWLGPSDHRVAGGRPRTNSLAYRQMLSDRRPEIITDGHYEERRVACDDTSVPAAVNGTPRRSERP